MLTRSKYIIAMLVFGAGIIHQSFLCQLARAAEVVPLSLTETVRQADAIVLGTVSSANTRWGSDAHRWLVTDYAFAIEEVIYASGKSDAIGQTITVSYWGGTLGEESQAVNGVRLPAVGERLLLVLKEGWRKQVQVSPLVGLNYGLFKVAPAREGGAAVVLDAQGAPLARNADGGMRWRSSAAEKTTEGVAVEAFVAWLRSNVQRIKSGASEVPQADRADSRVLKTFALPAYVPTPLERPETDAVNPPASEGLTAPAAVAGVQSGEAPSPISPAETAGDVLSGITPRYSVPRVASVPINVNNFPSSFAPWSPEDQYQMAKWNHYANIFRVFTTPTGNWAWGNDRFDLCGWPSSADMQAQFGAPWDANTIGICYTRWNTSTNVILEGDIALNPAFSFTLDDEWVNDGSTARSFRQVLSHELGHMWGLAHQFNFLSIMNDSQSVFRFFAFPYMDDAEAIRAGYPAVAVARTDLAVYLRYATGTQSITDATYPTNATAGVSFTVTNYHVENVGTAAISTPTIEWYLTSARNYSSAYYFLGNTTYPSLARFTYFTPSTVGRTLSIPPSVPGGSYYLAAYIRNDSAPSQGSYPFSNDFAFSRTRMTVAGATYTVSPSAGSNGSISPSTAQTVSYNGSRAFTATPVSGYIVDRWYLDGVAVQTGGTSYTVSSVTANRSVQVTFKRALTSVASRKLHGGTAYDLDLPLTGAAAVESRQSGTSHTIIFTFANSLTAVGSATLTQGSGSVSSVSIGNDPRLCTVTLSNVADAQLIRVSLNNTTDTFGNAATVASPMTVLLGDSNGDSVVNAADVSLTRSRSGQALTSTNFLSDVNADGAINSADATITRSRSGSSVSPAP